MPSGLLKVLNRLLPFATPGTPLVQDLLHLAALCLVLYYAPQIQEITQTYRRGQPTPSQDTADNTVESYGQDNPPDVQDLVDNNPGNEGQEADIVPPDEQMNDAVQPQHHVLEEGQPGPARVPNVGQRGDIGAKKAKSLARRDQRRAYHEFMRSQGDAQRARDAEGAAEREAALAAEKERRKAAEAALDAKKAKEREERWLRGEHERADELKRRELAVSIVRSELYARNMSDLFNVAEQVGGDVDEVWVEKILNAAGVIGRKGDTLTMATSMGWVVRVTEEQMANLYIAAAENGMGDADGRVEMEDLGAVLETMLRA
jgi:hypothetical protein